MDKNAIAARERAKMSRKISRMTGELYLIERSGLLNGVEAHKLRICLVKMRSVHGTLSSGV